MSAQKTIMLMQRLRNQLQALNIALIEASSLLSELVDEVNTLYRELEAKKREVDELTKKLEQGKTLEGAGFTKSQSYRLQQRSK